MEDIDAAPPSPQTEDSSQYGESKEGETGSGGTDSIESPAQPETPEYPIETLDNEASAADSSAVDSSANLERQDSPSLEPPSSESLSPSESLSSSLEALRAMLDETLEQAKPKDLSTPVRPYNRSDPPAGSVVITGIGFQPPVATEQESEGLKAEEEMNRVVVSAATRALKDAGIPLSQRNTGEEGQVPGPANWMLPEPLRSETGIVLANAWPGTEDLHRVVERYDGYKRTYDQLKTLGELSRSSGEERAEKIKGIARIINELASNLDDSRGLAGFFGALTAEAGKIAAILGTTGPAIQSRTSGMVQAVSQAEDWIRTGRCRRAIIISTTMVGVDSAGGRNSFNAEKSGAAVSAETEAFNNDEFEGWGAYSLVVESEDAVCERGMRGVAELIGSEIGAVQPGTGQELIDQMSAILDHLVSGAERRFDLYRADMAPRMVFLAGGAGYSNEGYPLGLSVLETVFGASAGKVIITSPDQQCDERIGVQILESGYVPPAPSPWFADAAMDRFLLSKGENYAPHYLLNLGRISANNFAMTLLRWIPGEDHRLEDEAAYQQWLDDITGYEETEVEAKEEMLQILIQEHAEGKPKPSTWRYGVGPMILAIKEELELPTAPLEKIVGLATTLAGSELADEVVVLPSEETEDGAVSLTTQDQEPFSDDEAWSPEIGLDAIAFQALLVASEHTGYGIEAIGLDDDLKRTLAIGEKEHAELLIEICQVFGVPGYVNLIIGDYPTLGDMIALVRMKRPDLITDQTPKNKEEESIVVSTRRDGDRPEDGSLIAASLQIVSNHTGYPVDMLEHSLDMDLEDDLGIDNIEQMEVFRALCLHFSLECAGTNQPTGFSTLSLIFAYLQEELGGYQPEKPTEILAGQKLSQAEMPTDPGSGERPIEFAIAETVLLITSEQTGMPVHEINIDADMVAELDLDEGMRTEIVSAVLESFGIPQPEGMHPSDYPTLSALILFVRQSRPDLVDTELLSTAGIEETLISGRDIGTARADSPMTIVRSIPQPKRLPAVDDCPSTGISFAGKRIVVMSDRGGVGDALGQLLPELEASVLTLTATTSGDELDECILDWSREGPIDGVYWLPALDVEPPLAQMTIQTWRELNRQRVKNLHRIMRTLYSIIDQPESFLLTATRMGGTHGCSEPNMAISSEGLVPLSTLAPLGGSVTGFAKAFCLERDKLGSLSPLVKAVDFEKDRRAGEIAKALLMETTNDPGTFEVGYMGSDRYGLSLVETPFPDDETGVSLDQDTIYLVTGAAKRLTNEIVADLASNGGTFYLLDYVSAPDRDDPRVALLRSDKKALREQLVDEIKTAVPEPTASMVEKIMKAIEREEAALRAIESVERQGGTAHYMCVDMLDDAAVARIVDEIRKNHGRIDVLVHAAGLDMSRSLPDKDPVQFNLVYDVKADGFFNLLKASEEMPLEATVVFASMETRHGTWGQADSGAAAELLRKITSSLAWQRPGTRGLAISWITGDKSAFDTRWIADDSAPALSTQFSILREELTSSLYHGEVVISADTATSGEE